MQVKLHKNATTTLAVRQAIKGSPLSAYALSKRYGISQTNGFKDGKPIEVYKLTYNGFEFSYKALPKHNKRTKKTHPFDKICQTNKTQHRTIRFKHPWTLMAWRKALMKGLKTES